MKELMDLDECKQKRLIKKIKPDSPLIISLIETGNRKIQTNNQIELNDITASTKVTIIYDSLREILEAVAIQRGIKIYNHECFCAFLTEICGEELFSVKFNKFRKIRNSINYYGKNITLKEAEIIIQEMIHLRKEIKEKLLN
jgi:hypothetical protein